ncbi:MAG: DUF559 domain-containing protein [Ignavibacteriaceae bacterium]|nr:DUF559 domain-containing protein [Ignavibacteriaceae bacterium]
MSLTRNPKLVEIAKMLCRELRKKATETEKMFWDAVRDRKFLNKKFYRQYPLFFDFFGKETFYIADFYCHECKTVVEIDGGYHIRQKNYDQLKNEVIKTMGIKVVRFTNAEIQKNLIIVLTKLKDELKNDSL